MRRSAASSVWLGAVVGALIAFALVLLLSIAFSLTLGQTLDQGSFGTISTGQVGNSVFVAGSDSSVSFYSNPLILLAYAHRTTINLNGSAGTLGTTLTASASVTPPITLLLLIPAIGLIFGGYFAASTNYSGRRLFSITRGASIGILYALLVLLISLVASTSITISTTSVNFSPDALSAFLSGLACGVVFGALGGALQGRSIPPIAQARPVSRARARIRGALVGSAWALGIYFVLCLILVLALYVVAQVGGPALHTQGTPSLTTSNSTCQVFLQQPDSSAQPILQNNFATHLSFVLESPALALWVMTVSTGAPLQISASGVALTIGYFNTSCQPGPDGILLYLFLLLPAASIFLGGWLAARSAQPGTSQEAAGIGLLMAPTLAILLLLFSLLASISVTISLFSLSSTANFGPAVGWTLLAGLLFGGVFGVLGSLAGRPRHLPPPQPAVVPGWPATPGAWPPAQPTISSAVASFKPADLEPAADAPGDQPSGDTASSVPPDTTPSSEEPQT